MRKHTILRLGRGGMPVTRNPCLGPHTASVARSLVDLDEICALVVFKLSPVPILLPPASTKCFDLRGKHMILRLGRGGCQSPEILASGYTPVRLVGLNEICASDVSKLTPDFPEDWNHPSPGESTKVHMAFKTVEPSNVF